jgi:hypothetical protein
MSSEGQQSTEFPASVIPVSLFREILIWPLALHLAEPATDPHAVLRAINDRADQIASAYQSGTTHWQPVDDLIEHICPPLRPAHSESEAVRCDYEMAMVEWKAHSYAEAVFFHEFVQSFLFSWRSSLKQPNPPVRLFRRDDVSELEVDLDDERTFRLKVERLNLYLFRSGAALLVLEISTEGVQALHAWKLSDVQDFHELLPSGVCAVWQTECGPQLGAIDAAARPGGSHSQVAAWP